MTVVKLINWLRNNYAVIAAISAAACVVLSLSFGVAWAAGSNSSSAADWLSAISTFAAFAAAGIAVHFAHRAYQIEEARDKARLRGERRAQAELVAVWPGEVEFGYKRINGQTRPNQIKGASALLRNASSVPVWQVAVEFVILRLPTPDGQLPDGQFRSVTLRLSVLPPTDTPTMVSCSEFEPIPYTGPDTQEAVEKQVLCRLWFTDSQNRRWVRDEQGRLSRG